MLAIEAKFDWTGDKTLFERAAANMRKPEKLMEQIGIVGMRGSFERLRSSLDADSIKTGFLAGSLNVSSATGGGNSNTIFDVDRASVEIGSNLPYAAQRNFGGRIDPIPPNKALAIPLVDAIKRSGIGPGQADPNREILSFVPVSGGASGNVIGLLVDDEGLFGRQGEALYALATHVDQEGAFFMGWDSEDRRVIEQDVWPRFVTG